MKCCICETKTPESCGDRRSRRCAMPARRTTFVTDKGYSSFQHHSHEIALDLLVFVPLEDPIKISRLRIRNTSTRRRRLSVTAYVEWVLGTSRGASAPFVVTEIDAQTGAMFARNPWNSGFNTRVAFADLAGRQTQWTGDRREFLGRHGSLEQPAALTGNAATLRTHGRRTRSMLCDASVDNRRSRARAARSSSFSVKRTRPPMRRQC